MYSMYQSVHEALQRQTQLSSGAALWVPAGTFEQADGSALKQSLQGSFGMGLYCLGEQCTDELNQWAQDSTNGHVLRVVFGPELQQLGPSRSVLSLVSHCKVRWATGFNERLT